MNQISYRQRENKLLSRFDDATTVFTLGEYRSLFVPLVRDENLGPSDVVVTIGTPTDCPSVEDVFPSHGRPKIRLSGT